VCACVGVCVYRCVCVCARARVRDCVYVCVEHLELCRETMEVRVGLASVACKLMLTQNERQQKSISSVNSAGRHAKPEIPL
jgi:hypothetical protein